jgi:hypothetical protein
LRYADEKHELRRLIEMTSEQQSAVPDVDGHDDAIMLGALGILAYVASMMTHEALGHAVLCVQAGGHNVMLSGWAEGCDLAPLPLRVTVAGPLAQFGAGLLAWLAIRQLSAGVGMASRSFLWLYMVFDLLISSSYVAFSGLTDFGDGAVAIAGLSPHWLWRTLLVLVGAVLYYLSMWAAAVELGRIIDHGGNKRLRRFLWIPYITAGVLACCAGALNKTMAPGTAIGLAALSSFGSGFGMVRVPDLQCGEVVRTAEVRFYVTRNLPWVAAALVAGAVFVFVLGPGVGAPFRP